MGIVSCIKEPERTIGLLPACGVECYIVEWALARVACLSSKGFRDVRGKVRCRRKRISIIGVYRSAKVSLRLTKHARA